MTERVTTRPNGEPAGTTRLDNGAIRYDCCGETGGTPSIYHVENEHGVLTHEVYDCPHCGAYQGEREINPKERMDERSKRAFNEV